MHRIIIFALAALAAAASACSVSAQDNVAASIPLDLSGPRPTAQLVIGDAAPVTAIFDTGAAASVLRLSYAQRIGVANEGQANARAPNGAPIQGFRTTIDHARLGDAQFGSALAVALDISLPLPGVDAIVSPGVFSGQLVRFDFSASVAQVLPLTPANIPRAPAEPFTGENSHGRMTSTPGVRVTLPGAAPMVLIIDTGSRGGLDLPYELSRSLPLSEPLTPVEPTHMIGADLPAFRSRINGTVQIGGVALQNPEVRFEQGASQGTVGFGILRNAIVVIDPRGRRAWVLPPETP